MNTPSEITAGAARSQAWQLFALLFVHPQRRLHACLADGSFQAALAGAMTRAGHDGYLAATVPASFPDFEAGYIGLFDTGRNGRPSVPLNAAEYEALRHGRSRSEQMLEYLRCYRYFGVRLKPDAQANELPDHLSCQLEFMAWLAHLEAGTGDRELARGYVRAQRDFLTRLLRPQLREMRVRLAGAVEVPAFFNSVITELDAFSEASQRQADRVGEPEVRSSPPAAGESSPEVTLWD